MQYALSRLVYRKEWYASEDRFKKQCSDVFQEIANMGNCRPQRHLLGVAQELVWSLGIPTFDPATGERMQGSP